MTGARILVEVLIEQGVRDVFGYPGGQAINIYDQLYLCRDRINHILTAHEQGAAHAADGYARATGKTGVVIATSGPGATNLVTGIATAMLDSSPLVAITGNVPLSLIGKDSFQEIDITGITLPITKHNFFVTRVEDLADEVREAFRIARSGRPGPVLVDIPKDVQTALCEYQPKAPLPLFENKKAKEQDINRAVELLNGAKRPYIYIGGGVVGAGLEQAVAELAQKIDAVVGCSLMGLTGLASDQKSFLGLQGMHGHYASSAALSRADVIFGVGVRFSDRATGDKKKYAKNAAIIHIDVDGSEIDKIIPSRVGIAGDLTDSFTRIAKKVKKAKHPEWIKQIKELKAREQLTRSGTQSDQNDGQDGGSDGQNGQNFDPANGAVPHKNTSQGPAKELTPSAVFDCINQVTGGEATVATDVGQHQMWAAQFCKFRHPRSFITSGGLGTMGFGMGAAMGASVATGKKTVLITGDGSFGMNLNELATAVTYNIPLVIVLFNNGVLGMVRQWQSLFFDGRFSATTLGRATDFVKLAEAFGAKGIRAISPEQFKEAFKSAYENETGPIVIECPINKDELVLPMLPPGGSMDDLIIEKEEDL